MSDLCYNLTRGEFVVNQHFSRKKICVFVVYFFYVASFTLINCQGASKPRTALTSCLEAMIKGDYEKAYGFFSFTDRSTISLTEFIQYNKVSKEEIEFAETSTRYVSYEIKELSVAGDTARAVVKITAPEIMIERFNLLLYEIYRMRVVDSVISPQDKSLQLPIIGITGIASLVKESGGWRVHGQWQEQRKKEAEISKFKLDYVQNKLKIRNINIKEYQDIHKTLLTATLKNMGQRTLKDVEIFLVCSNIDDKPRYTVTEHPISESGKPLGPKRARKFEIDLTNVPSDWARRIEIKIVNCKFVE